MPILEEDFEFTLEPGADLRRVLIARSPEDCPVSAERGILNHFDVAPNLNHLFDDRNRPSETLRALLEHFDLTVEVGVLDGLFADNGQPSETVAAILDMVELTYEEVPVSQLPLEFVWKATQLAFFHDYRHLYSAELRPIINDREAPDERMLELLKQLGSRDEVSLQSGDIGSLVFFGATAASIESRLEFLADQLDRSSDLQITELVLLGGERGVLGSDRLEIFQRLDPQAGIEKLTDLPFIRPAQVDDDPRFKGNSVVREAEMVEWIWNRLRDSFPCFDSANAGDPVAVKVHQTTLADIGPGRQVSAIDTLDRWLESEAPLSDRFMVVGQQPYMYRQVAQVLGELIKADVPISKLRGIGFGAQDLGEYSLQELMKDLTVKIDLYRKLINVIGEKAGGWYLDKINARQDTD